MNVRRAVAVAFVAVWAVGCSMSVVVDRANQPVRGPLGSETAKEVAELNRCRLALYEDEFAVSEGPPKFGLALSGGGMRSASFSMGVLEALQAAEGTLQSVDVISSVSGGAYTASWYVTHRAAGVDPAALFAHDGKYQQHIEENGDLMPMGWGIAWALYSLGFGGPVNLVTNGF